METLHSNSLSGQTLGFFRRFLRKKNLVKHNDSAT